MERRGIEATPFGQLGVALMKLNTTAMKREREREREIWKNNNINKTKV